MRLRNGSKMRTAFRMQLADQVVPEEYPGLQKYQERPEISAVIVKIENAGVRKGLNDRIA